MNKTNYINYNNNKSKSHIEISIQDFMLHNIFMSHPICDRYIKFGLLINSAVNSKFKRKISKTMTA